MSYVTWITRYIVYETEYCKPTNVLNFTQSEVKPELRQPFQKKITLTFYIMSNIVYRI